MRWRRLGLLVGIVAVSFGLAIFVSAQAAVGSLRTLIVSAQDVAGVPVVIVPGASVLRNKQPSDVLADRLLTAIDLYEAGKVEKILVSGDHGQKNYDEVNVMREYLLTRGVDAEDIFLDHAGFDTYDTMYRARYLFGVEKAIVASQTFHLPRALYIGQSLGMTVQGVAAERQRYIKDAEFAFRERFAIVKAYLDVIVGSEPAYLGTVTDISGDGRVTWDEGL